MEKGSFNMYETLGFWKHYIKNNKNVWQGLFKNIPLSKDSLFIQTNIYNGNQMHNSWACYPNVESLMGFIKYVFFPSVIVTWLTREEHDEVIYDVDNPYDLLDMLKDDIKEKYKRDIKEIKAQLDIIDGMKGLSRGDFIKEVTKLSNSFNSKWFTNRTYMVFNVYSSPKELTDDIIRLYKSEGLIDILEEESGLTVYQWREMVGSIYSSKFMKRKFVDILNNKLYTLTI